MQVTIAPSTAVGVVTAPPSKSITHRALICGALSEKSTIQNVAYSQDVEATLRCLETMGAAVKRQENQVEIGGLDPFALAPDSVLDCGESGSTLRFLLPLCLLSDVPVHLTGSPRLLERPLDVYETICREQHLSFVRTESVVSVCGPLTAGRYRVSGNVSSQFISGLMWALSLLDGDSVIEVLEPFESQSYVSITQMVQSDFGVTIRQDKNQFFIAGNSRYQSREYTIEGDYSNTAFLDAFNLLGGDVKVIGLTSESAQGDRVYKGFYRQLQEDYRIFDMSDCPDLGPVMFALAAALGGATFIGTARLRLKESDRIACMVQELEKFGVSTTVEENAVTIYPVTLQAPALILNGHNDHRIVMALSLLCSKVGGTIDGAEAVAKSYPDYFNVIRQLGIKLVE